MRLADQRADMDWFLPSRALGCVLVKDSQITYSKKRYKQRNLIERCFNKLKQFRHIAMRVDHNPLNDLAIIKLA